MEVDYKELDKLSDAMGKRLLLNLPDAPESLNADSPVNLAPPSKEDGGPFELDESLAIVSALQNRLDLKVVLEQAIDAQRKVAVAANALQAGLDLTATANVGSSRSLSTVRSPDGRFDPDEGVYTAGVLLDLPFARSTLTGR